MLSESSWSTSSITWYFIERSRFSTEYFAFTFLNIVGSITGRLADYRASFLLIRICVSLESIIPKSKFPVSAGAYLLSNIDNLFEGGEAG